MIDWLNYFPAFLLVFVRVTTFFVTLPLFSYRSVPANFKVGIAFFLSLIMAFSLDLPVIEIDGFYILLVLKELLVGLLIGLIAYMIMAAIQIAGGFIDFQMGFAIANVIDPQTGAQSPIIGQYFYIFALLLLLSVNGHHLMIDGIFYSYQLIDLTQGSLPMSDENVLEFVVQVVNTMFLVAFQLAIPIVGALFLVDVALGIVARTVPQLNVFVVGLPLKIGVSFIAILVSFTILFSLIYNLFEMMLYAMRGLMDLLGGM
ncbi:MULTISPECIES: flagellar biosynthetic protein FliR [Sutcliffiella]|uniref:Flagellar biosynthetic protein FliR n=1 Tax=Sutcliffiella cohnii TaxID=33932 RepID=A0A223KRD1_9BACI|nr:MULTISPECIES: flagellar biosynthetic protein FliR [Sutcliffiella]AST92045.1 flagellar biosynthetic protein FliR [Sutcliffiella cohnii]MED4015326.1 flagellar biosynthetic protein FliR [Sutcliffiella cohnii]WBL13279.1 flagellar biosynthetic protein FliR [Sutcliffiella sp. NC1]